MERIHIFWKGSSAHPVLLLLHGTGGTEHDLLYVGSFLDDEASLLSLRGEVDEHGLSRHFKRLAEGIYDQADLDKRTQDLEDFINKAASKYGFPRDNIIGLGYSNGANLLGSHLFHFPGSIKGALLLHPKGFGSISAAIKMKDLPIFIGAGENDPICSSNDTISLTEHLKKAGASVFLSWHDAGHRLSHAELEAAYKWYAINFK